jgi:hypothetical protein
MYGLLGVNISRMTLILELMVLGVDPYYGVWAFFRGKAMDYMSLSGKVVSFFC